MIPSKWVHVGRAADVPMLEGRSVFFAGRRIAIFHLPDRWAALDHACPHAGGPLADGIVSDNCVTCPLHGARFALGSGARVDVKGEAVATYPVRERDGMLELHVSRDDSLQRAA